MWWWKFLNLSFPEQRRHRHKLVPKIIQRPKMSYNLLYKRWKTWWRLWSVSKPRRQLRKFSKSKMTTQNKRCDRILAWQDSWILWIFGAKVQISKYPVNTSSPYDFTMVATNEHMTRFLSWPTWRSRRWKNHMKTSESSLEEAGS